MKPHEYCQIHDPEQPDRSECEACQKDFEHSALEAGIPLAVIRGEAELKPEKPKRDGKIRDQKGREVEVSRVDGHVGEGAYIEECYYADDDSEVPDDVIDWLNDNYAEQLYEQFYEDMVGRAEDAFDAMRDR